MSIKVRPATAAAVSASISTPVCPTTRTFASTRTAPGTNSKSSATLDSGSGWHRGISSEVRFAAMIPATRATWMASPLAVPSRTARSVAGAIRTRHSASASRVVTALTATSTMRAAPRSSRCVKRFATFATRSGYSPVAAIDGVMFDYGQTLVTFAFPRDELLEVIRNFLPTIEEALGGPAPLAEALLEDVFMPLEEYVTSTSEDEVDWLDVFKASWDRAGMSLPDGLLYEMADAEQLCWDRIVKVDPDAMQVLSTLRDRGIKRVLCSNAPFPPEMMRRQVTTNGIGPLMDAVIFSSMVGKRKPAVEM